MRSAGRRRAWRARAAAGALAALALLAVSAASRAADPSPAGLWQSVSDVDGKPKAHIRIREENGEFLGVVEQVLDPKKADARCDKCTDERRDKPVLGMTILSGVRRDGDSFGGGKILDPNTGKIYSCKLTPIEGGARLEVRGYLGFSLFGRTQTWVRIE